MKIFYKNNQKRPGAVGTFLRYDKRRKRVAVKWAFPDGFVMSSWHAPEVLIFRVPAGRRVVTEPAHDGKRATIVVRDEYPHGVVGWQGFKA